MLNLPQKPKWDIARVSHSTLVNADCFDVFPFIEDKSVDMILCDLPYGTTQNKYDIILPFDKLWEQYERVIKDNGAIVLFGQGLFFVGDKRYLKAFSINYKYTQIYKSLKKNQSLFKKNYYLCVGSLSSHPQQS